jgi:hypothetical protein
MRPGIPEQFGAYMIVRANQAKTHEGDVCRRPSCSHPRKSHQRGAGPCEFAMVCICHTYVGEDAAPPVTQAPRK